MNKTAAAKAIVGHLTSFAVGSATQNVLKTNIPKTNNAAINLMIDASVVVGAWMVSGTVMEPVRKHADEKIDQIATQLSTFSKKN